MLTTLMVAAAMLSQPAAAATEIDHGVAGRGPLRPVTITEELSVRPLGADAWVVVHDRPWAANSLLVRMADGTLVLCDTPYDDRATRQLLDWLGETFGDVRIVAVNSHFHADALGGNGALREAGAISYGSTLTAQMLKERGATNKRQLLEYLADRQELQARFKEAKWLAPAEQFAPDKAFELSFGDEKLVLYYPGAGHSPDNIVAWFPKRRLLFGGCLVRAGDSIPNVADADLDAWATSIENLRRFEPLTIVPGHGRAGGPELLDRTQRLVAERKAKEDDR